MVTERSRKEKQEIQESVYKNFEKLFSDKARVFNYPEMLRKLKIDRDAWVRGIEMAKENHVMMAQEPISNGAFLSGNGSWRVLFRYVDRMGADVEYHGYIVYTRDEIIEIDSQYPEQTGSYYVRFDNADDVRFTPAMAAMVFLLGGYLYEYNPGTFTDRSANYLAHQLETGKLRIASKAYNGRSVKSEQEPLVLEPVIKATYHGEYQIRFRIGYERKYMIQNLEEFIGAVDREHTMKFGKKNEFQLGESYFAPGGQKYLDFIRTALRSMNWFQQEFRVDRAFKGIPMESFFADRFYELLGEDAFEFNPYSSSRKVMLTVAEGDLDMKATVTAYSPEGVDDLSYAELTLSFPDFVVGDQYVYRFASRHLWRIPMAKWKELSTFGAVALGRTPLGRMPDPDMNNRYLAMAHFGKETIGSLMYDIVPLLERSMPVTIEDEDVINQYLPAVPQYEFFLDAPGSDVTCTAVCTYNEKSYNLFDKNAPDDLSRDKHQDDFVKATLYHFFPETLADGITLSCGGDEDAIYRFLQAGIERLVRIGDINATSRFQGIERKASPHVTVGIQLRHNNFLELSVDSGDMPREELQAILESYVEKRKFYRMKDGSFVNLEEEKFERLESLMDGLQLTPKQLMQDEVKLPAYRTLYMDKMLENSGDIEADRDQKFRDLVKAFKTVDDSDFPIPQELNGSLRKYQKVGYRWLRTLDKFGFGGILADDMGLGKTIQMISVVLALKEEGELNHPALIVAPASVIYNWEEEFKRFAPSLSTFVLAGNAAERADQLKDNMGRDVIITSYDLLKRDIMEYEGLEFRIEVIDEAQYIKNFTTAAAKATKLIYSQTRFALTGTPIENRLSELWSIFDYLMPGFLYKYPTFRKRFEKPIVTRDDENRLDRLKTMVSPFILRRFKKDVLKDLPDKLEEIYYSRMGEKQSELYRAKVQEIRSQVKQLSEKDFKKNRVQILSALTRIRQICCDPSLCYTNYNGGSAKREAAVELIERAVDQDHQILVFSQFVSMLDLLGEELDKKGIRYFRIEGKTAKVDRIRLVERFNRGDRPVFLISLRAGGTGLNLTGADVVIHYDPWWNLAVQNQATDRAYRIGQKRKVTVYKMIMKGTLEERIVEIQNSKRELAEDVLDTESAGSGVLNQEDLLAMLEDC